MAGFEKRFKELSAKEEKAAIEKIAGILANLTATKANMVTEALENANEMSLEAKNRLQLEMSHVQHVSIEAKKEWIAYIEKLENQFQDDAFSTSETRATMENNLEYCLKKVGHSMHHWENTQSSISQFSKDHTAEIESWIQTRNQEKDNLLEEFISVCSRADVEFDGGISHLLDATNNSVRLDHESTSELSSMSKKSSFLSKTLQDHHDERIKDTRNLADKFLLKEYLVQHSTRTPPRKQVIDVPSFSSIEALRSPAIADMGSERKLQFVAKKNPRSPLVAINSCEIKD